MKDFSVKFFIITFLLLMPAFTLAQVTLTLPTSTGAPGTEVLVPITVNDLTGLGLSSYQFQINYNPAVINITDLSTTGTLSAGGSASKFVDFTNGKFRVAWARAGNADGTPNPLVGSGTLINIKIKYIANGTTPVTYIASDGFFVSRFGSYTITSVNGSITTSIVNNPPVFTPVPSKSVNEGELLNFTVSATDPEGSAVIYSTGTLPTGASFNTSTRTFTWTPSYGQAGVYNVEFKASDGNSTTSMFVTITVVSVNQAPTLTLNPAGPYSINEGSQLNIQLVGNDVNSGTTLTYSYTSTPAATGAVLNTSTGAFSWTPVTNQYGTYNVTFTVSDGSLTASVSTVITVVKVNIPPTLTLNPAGPFSVNEGSQLNIQLVGADVNNGTTLQYFFSSLPAAAGATLNSSTGLFSWTPGFDQAGVYNFTFTVSDGQYSTNVTSQITVVDVNAAPTFTLPTTHTFTVAEAATSNNTVQFSAAGAPGITYSMLPNTPSLSWVSFNPATATLTLTPSYGVSTAVAGGVYSITIRAASTNGFYTDFVLTVTVTTTFRNPIWTGAGTSTISSKAIKYNETFNFSYIAYDPDGHTITYSLQSVTPSTSSAVFTNQSGFGGFGQLIFTPAAADQGKVFTIVIQATCSAGLFATTTTLLTVGVNTPPAFTNVLTNQTIKVHNVPVAFNFQYGATDIDGDPYIFSLISGKGSMTSTGKYSWIPVAEDKGTTNTVQVRVSDANNFLVYSETSAILTVENFITGVQNSEEIPGNFVVSQNYPNPFNPSTAIQFGIPTASNVRAVVYNVLGEEVAVLVNGYLPAGYHKFTFTASNLPSGLYLCRVQTDNMTLVKKMMLAK